MDTTTSTTPTAAFKLLQLPDACLLRVLQCLVADNDYQFNQRSLFSAARAHTRLHAVAAEVLSALRAHVLGQQRVDGVLRYLSRHGQHVTSISLSASTQFNISSITQLPTCCSQLRSLSFKGTRRAAGLQWPAHEAEG
jgi:hypothetical protein